MGMVRGVIQQVGLSLSRLASHTPHRDTSTPGSTAEPTRAEPSMHGFWRPLLARTSVLFTRTRTAGAISGCGSPRPPPAPKPRPPSVLRVTPTSDFLCTAGLWARGAASVSCAPALFERRAKRALEVSSGAQQRGHALSFAPSTRADADAAVPEAALSCGRRSCSNVLPEQKRFQPAFQPWRHKRLRSLKTAYRRSMDWRRLLMHSPAAWASNSSFDAPR